MRLNASPAQPEQWPRKTQPLGLREVPGGYDITRWPITVHPRPDEPFDSWLCRTAFRYGLTPAGILREALGASRPSRPNSLEKAESDNLTTILGVEAPQAWSLPDSSRPTSPQGFPISETERGRWRSRFCPRCLSDDPAWKFSWRSATTLLCHEHQLLLNDVCPACGVPPWTSPGWISHSLGSVTCAAFPQTPAEPGARRVRRICGYNLATALAQPATPAVSEAVKNFLEVFRLESSEADYRLGTMHCTTGQAVDALCVLLRLAGGEVAPTRTSPQFLTALKVAHRAFCELTETRGWGPTLDDLLHPGGVAAPLGPATNARAAALGPVLIAAALRTHAPSNLADALMLRTSRPWPAHPDTWVRQRPGSRGAQRLPDHQSSPDALPARWIPQTCWPEEIPAPLDQTDPIDRTLFSLLLLKLGRANRWAELAFELDLPATHIHQFSSRLSHLTRHDRRRLNASAEDTAARLADNPPPIDYRRRRLLYLQKPLLIATALASLGELDVRRRPPSQRIMFIRRYWEVATEGDIAFGPEGIWLVPGTVEYRDYASTRASLDDEMHGVVQKVLPHLLQYDFGEEPTSWAPT